MLLATAWAAVSVLYETEQEKLGTRHRRLAAAVETESRYVKKMIANWWRCGDATAQSAEHVASESATGYYLYRFSVLRVL